MTAKESIIDQLGQITFRLETNHSFLQKKINLKNDLTNNTDDAIQSVTNDLEKLKHLKTQIEIWLNS